jgi:hypothetical protein
MAYSINSSKVSDFIAIVSRLEAAYPQWTTNGVVDTLRATSAYDTLPFQLILKASPGHYLPNPPRSPLSLMDRSDIYDFMTHDTDDTHSRETLGVCIDQSSGRKTTIGHVIVGISAALNHPKELVEITVTPADLGLDVGTGVYREEDYFLGLDPLYATTITGDLGSTVATRQLDSKIRSGYINPLGGIGSEATEAELIGDIDGFLIGYWLSTTTKGQEVRTAMTQNNYYKLSTILGEYYRTRTDRPIGMMAGSGYPLEAVRRFSNMNASLPYLRTTMIEQTKIFRKAWSLFTLKKPQDYFNGELEIMLTRQSPTSTLGVSEVEKDKHKIQSWGC